MADEQSLPRVAYLASTASGRASLSTRSARSERMTRRCRSNGNTTINRCLHSCRTKRRRFRLRTRRATSASERHPFESSPRLRTPLRARRDARSGAARSAGWHGQSEYEQRQFLPRGGSVESLLTTFGASLHFQYGDTAPNRRQRPCSEPATCPARSFDRLPMLCRRPNDDGPRRRNDDRVPQEERRPGSRGRNDDRVQEEPRWRTQRLPGTAEGSKGSGVPQGWSGESSR